MRGSIIEKRMLSARDSGFVLVSVLWILAILTVVSLGFASRSMLERRMAWYALDREQAQQMARGAAERALFELANKASVDAYNNQVGYTGIDQHWARPVDLMTEGPYFESVVDREEFGEDVSAYRIEDCERWISLNHAQRDVLEELDGLSLRTVDLILDRRRGDGRGYQPELFRSVAELRAEEDFGDEVWVGDADQAGLRDLFTVWGDPGGLINVNTAPAAVVRSIPGLDAAVAERIIEFRAGGGRKVVYAR